jgi:hypothetical protein
MKYNSISKSSLKKIFFYKDRTIDFNRPVIVYRNLNARLSTHKFSIKQNNLVVAHTNELYLTDCIFFVGLKGRERALKTKQRNVHAYVKGLITDRRGYILRSGKFFNYKDIVVEYNPFKHDCFYANGTPIFKNDSARIKDKLYI